MNKQYNIELVYELDEHDNSPCAICGGPVPEHPSSLYFSLVDDAGNVCEQCAMQHAPELVKERDDIFGADEAASKTIQFVGSGGQHNKAKQIVELLQANGFGDVTVVVCEHQDDPRATLDIDNVTIFSTAADDELVKDALAIMAHAVTVHAITNMNIENKDDPDNGMPF